MTCCKNGHERTPENTYVTPSTGRSECLLCKRERHRKFIADHPGYSTDAVRKYREDPEKRERDRERSRRWKREHLGQPGLAALTSGASCKTPGNQIGPASGATDRDRGNQETES
jgi:hypothetical protein